VILLEGVNDILNGRSDAEIIDNLIGMVGIVIGTGAQPILATLPPTCCDRRFSQPESRIRSLNARITSFATVNTIPLIDFFAAFVPDPAMTNPPYAPSSGLVHVPEGLHPTPLGYDVMAATASEIF
jgi:lysophospholipase L1-like esterase